MRNLIFHSIAMRKGLSFSIALSVAMSVMTLFALGLTYDGVMRGIHLNSERSGAQIMVIPTEAALEIDDTSLLFTGAPAPIYMPASSVDEIASIKGVARATPQFFTQTLNESCCSTTGATRLIGVDFSSDWAIAPFAPSAISENLKNDQVIIGAHVGSSANESLTVLGKHYSVIMRLDPSGSDLDNSILLDIDTARALASEQPGFSHYWDKYGQPNGLVSCILIELDGSVEPQIIKNRIAALGGMTVLERSKAVEAAQRSLETVFAILLGTGALFLISTLVQLFARFYACVWERKGELSLYRAIGANTSQIRMLIGGEVFLIVLFGFIVGIVLGMVFYGALLSLLSDMTAFPFVEGGLLVTTAFAGKLALLLAACSLGALGVPLRQIGRLDPSLVMQQGGIG